MNPLVLLPLLVTASETDPEWTRFRGPNGTGVHPTATIPAPIAPDSETLRWRVELPPGYSSPVLTQDAVIVTGYEGCFLFTIAVSRESGKVLWRRECPTAMERPHNNVNTPCSPTPVSDGENVTVYYPVHGLVSYDAMGKVRWDVGLEELNLIYKPGTSPVQHGDTLLLQADQDTGSYLLALDANTGEERWRVDRPGTTHGFSSPSVYTPEDGPAQVIVNGSYRVTGYDLRNGQQLWHVDGMAWQAKSLPILDGDMLYLHSWMAAPSELGTKKVTRTWEEALEAMDANGDGKLDNEETAELNFNAVIWMLYDMNKDKVFDEEEWGYALARANAKNGLHAIQLGGEGNLTESAVKWSWKRSLPNVPSPILADGVLFVLKEGGVLTALNPADGETHSAGRVEGAQDTYYASPIAAGGELLLASHGGIVARVSASAEWELLETTEFEEEIWATPALATDGLYLRTQKALYAFGTPDEDEDEADE